MEEKKGSSRPHGKKRRRGGGGGQGQSQGQNASSGPNQQGGQGGGKSRRRGKRFGGGGGGGGGGGFKPRGKRDPFGLNDRQMYGGRPPAGAPNGVPQSRPPQQAGKSGRLPNGGFDVFELFCAYHLGITAEGGYRQQNIHDLARRFQCSPAELKQALMDNHIDADTLLNSDFDLAMAQIDIQVAPEGVDKRELARPWFEEFMQSHPNARDWQKELAEDAKENARVFGDDS